VTHEDGPADDPVRGIRFEGLTFVHNNRYPVYGRSGRGLQHDWEGFDRPTAMVRFRAAENCAVRACRLAAGAGTGIRMDLHAQNNLVEGCEIEQLGGCGIVLAGYGPGTKDVNRGNIIQNNHIHHIGLTTWHSPGIFIWQSGHNRVTHNHLHHTPYTGIVVSGRINLVRDNTSECAGTIRWDEVDKILGADYEPGAWHDPARWRADWERREPLLHARENILEHNDIHHVMLVMRDGNGIYISGAGRGNIVRRNLVHDCPSQYFSEGIRCDDDQHTTLIDGNVIFNLGGVKSTGIVIKGVNTVTNNIVAAPMIAGQSRSMVHLAVGPLQGTVIRNNILYATHTDHCFYREGRVHGEGPKGLLRDCEVEGNVYWNTADPKIATTYLEESQRQGIEQNSIAADPLFVAPARNDYRLRPDSPARGIGISQVAPPQAGVEAEAFTFRSICCRY
ncbi:MAG: right-handed parallel beta-helix repeat-containing protein, partial [Lentisphaerae bacterium]|nr:right-handed parallel beta-helix repeat-containing protein [Lentisphaerota bacterium]